jgi:hypothetical protein
LFAARSKAALAVMRRFFCVRGPIRFIGFFSGQLNAAVVLTVQFLA